MTSITPDEEHQFAETYAKLTNGELATLAAETDELAQPARIALRAEMERRGLSFDLSSASGEPQVEAEFKQLVTIRQFRDLPEALLAKGSLESAGIECSLWDDNLVRLDWFLSNLIGGMRLKVDPADAEAAEEILSQPIPEDLEIPGVGDYHQPHCPKCQSLDVAYRELNKPIAYISAYLNVPIPLEHIAWRCHDCHVEWEDDPDDVVEGSAS